jgi:hypothetical protein
VQSCPNGPIEDLSWATNYGLPGRVFMLTSRRYDDACFSLELGPEVANIICDHCGHLFKSVNGYIKRDDWAYSIYFATLQTGHADIEAGLTVSIGKWWDDSDSAVAERRWVYLRVWPSESGGGFELRIEEPEGSRHVDFENLGNKLSPDEARQSPLLNDFFAVADYAIDNDPAVLSYLSGNEINIAGRICKH